MQGEPARSWVNPELLGLDAADDDEFIPGNTRPLNTTHSSETPRSADTQVYRAGQYRPETHRYRRKG